jgi:rhomboid protease GluP
MAGRLGRWLWGRDIDLRRPWRWAPVSITLLALLVAVFVGERLSGPWQADVTDLRHLLGWAGPEIADGQVWRLLTAGFLHSDAPSRVGPYGLEHLLANAALLVVIAPRLEVLLRPRAFLAFVLVMQVVAFSAWAWLDTPAYFGVGASGWLAAVWGAVAVDAVRYRYDERLYAAVTVVWIAWFLVDPSIPTSAKQVHVVGLVAGGIYGLRVMAYRRGARRRAPRVLGVLGVIALVPIAWHALHVDERPAVQYGEPATVVPCSSRPGHPRTGADGTIEIVNQSGERAFVAEVTATGVGYLMVLHPDERIVGGLPVGTRVRLERADGRCLTAVEVSDHPTTLRIKRSGRTSR